MQSKNILVAPLNWGIGHATRCIPIINELLKQGFTPVIASDGNALLLLRKEFPRLKTIVLPSYNIKYPKKGKLLKWKLFLNTPSFLRAIKKEQKVVKQLVLSENLIGIISDNRLGVRSNIIPSVYITHQLNVFSGWMTYFTSKAHQYYINKFDECWIPDINSKDNFSGKLTQTSGVKSKKFIGVLSRLKKKELPIKYDVLVLLSGIEPLRSQLEKKLISEFKNYKGTVLFIKGVLEKQQKIEVKGNITFCNYLLTAELEKAINESGIVIARSGYSTIMDLAVMNKKAFFIPTTGQNEQEYLAKHLEELKIAPFSSEEKFKIEMLNKIESYNGFSIKLFSKLEKDLFNLFQCK